MCGIGGAFGVRDPRLNGALDRMSSALTHRGPDGSGLLSFDGSRLHVRHEPSGHAHSRSLDPSTPPVSLIHRRLSIIDVSSGGEQPMADHSGRYHVSFNGEIFNYLELRQTLSVDWRSGSDTETLVEAFAKWGPECLSHFNGIWAFALWDSREGYVFLARDRFGVKPLYYATLPTAPGVVFASEPKAILAFLEAMGAGRPEADDDVAVLYLANGLCDHGERTFFKGIHQLPPGHYAEVNRYGVKLVRYYDLPESHSAPSRRDPSELRSLLEDSMRLQLRSDVPVGHCLSGGLDSSTIACLTSARGNGHGQSVNQRTFSAVYPTDARIDERRYVDAVVAWIGADARFTCPSGDTLIEKDIQSLICAQDEPFYSLSMYAQYCVFRLVAESGVKVVLDGQGGDELFAGYTNAVDGLVVDLLLSGRFRRATKELLGYRTLHRQEPLHVVGRSLPSLAARAGSRAVAELMNRALEGVRDLRAAGRGPSSHEVAKAQLRLMSEWALEERGRAGRGALGSSLVDCLLRDPLPQLLRFEDRNSMAFGVEARVPLLDHRIVEWAVSGDPTTYVSEGITKVPLRNAVRDVLPPLVVERTDKIGYATPDADWLIRGRSFLNDVFSSRSFSTRFWFDAENVRSAHREMSRSKDLHATALVWRALNLELWARTFL